MVNKTISFHLCLDSNGQLNWKLTTSKWMSFNRKWEDLYFLKPKMMFPIIIENLVIQKSNLFYRNQRPAWCVGIRIIFQPSGSFSVLLSWDSDGKRKKTREKERIEERERMEKRERMEETDRENLSKINIEKLSERECQSEKEKLRMS